MKSQYKIGDRMMVKFPEQGYVPRMRVYLSAMYPILPRLGSSALLYTSFVTFFGRLQGVEISLVSFLTVVGIWSVFALMLILRLMDELKDKHVDSELFEDRPFPSGKVLESDLTFSLVAMIALYLVANIWVAKALWMAVVVVGYALLMFKYFFIPHILRKNLLLNLATHNWIIPLMLFYIVIMVSVEHELTLDNLHWPYLLGLIGMYWLVFFGWEISRKIRAIEEENAYITYSAILGPLGAVLTAAGAQTVAFSIGLYFYFRLPLSEIFLAVLLMGYGTTMWGHSRFLLNPTPITSKLQPFAARYIVSVLSASILEHGPLI